MDAQVGSMDAGACPGSGCLDGGTADASDADGSVETDAGMPDAGPPYQGLVEARVTYRATSNPPTTVRVHTTMETYVPSACSRTLDGACIAYNCPRNFTLDEGPSAGAIEVSGAVAASLVYANGRYSTGSSATPPTSGELVTATIAGAETPAHELSVAIAPTDGTIQPVYGNGGRGRLESVTWDGVQSDSLIFSGVQLSGAQLILYECVVDAAAGAFTFPEGIATSGLTSSAQVNLFFRNETVERVEGWDFRIASNMRPMSSGFPFSMEREPR